MVKCVAVIKEFYRKADKVQVKVLGRKKLSKKSKSRVSHQKEVDLYDDWTTEDWQEDEFLGSSKASKIFTTHVNYILFTLFLMISLLRN